MNTPQSVLSADAWKAYTLSPDYNAEAKAIWAPLMGPKAQFTPANFAKLNDLTFSDEEDWLRIDINKIRDSKNSPTKWADLLINLDASGDWRIANLKFKNVPMCANIKSPEDRAEDANKSDDKLSISMRISSGGVYARVKYVMNRKFRMIGAKHISAGVFDPDGKIPKHTGLQTHFGKNTKEAGMKNKPLDEPVIRSNIPFIKETRLPRIKILNVLAVVKNSKGKRSLQNASLPDGTPVDMNNIHQFSRSGSMLSGIDKTGAACESQSCLSLPTSFDILAVKPSANRQATMDSTFDGDDMDDIIGADTVDEPTDDAEEYADLAPADATPAPVAVASPAGDDAGLSTLAAMNAISIS
jgi:hypothetical protein